MASPAALAVVGSSMHFLDTWLWSHDSGLEPILPFFLCWALALCALHDACTVFDAWNVDVLCTVQCLRFRGVAVGRW